jgi:hypothetical protein
MNQQPDKLFRDKLEGYHKSVPPSAWSRLERKLDKKNRKPLLFKIAAAVLLLFCSSILWWFTHDTDKHSVVATRQSPTEQKKTTPQTVEPDNNDVLPSGKEGKIEIPKSQPVEKVKPSSRKAARDSQAARSTEEVKVPQPAEEKQIPEHVNEVVNSEKSFGVTHTEIIPQEKNKENSGSVTIIYTVDEVNEKYLNKKDLAEATPESKKPSTLKKLLDKAYDLKHNQDAFGELRQKKNEILALNFKNEKQQRTQNR